MGVSDLYAEFESWEAYLFDVAMGIVGVGFYLVSL